MSTHIFNRRIIFWVLLLSLTYLLIASCEPTPPENSREAQANRGKVHFMKYCAECHGENGQGLIIDSLNIQPADLTRITASTKEKRFPILQVARQIDGRQMIRAHGTRQMPIWGEVFSTNEELDETQIKGKLGEIIAYLMKIQD